MYRMPKEIKGTKSELAILAASKKLYWKYGISKVSVEEVCAEAEISKMTFYRYFKNKFEVVSIIMDQMTTEGIDTYRSIMSSKLPYSERLEKLMLFQKEQAASMSMEFITDLYKNEHAGEIVQLLQKNTEKFDQEIRSDFQQAIDEGHMRKGVTVDFIMHMLQVVRKESQNVELHKSYESTEEFAGAMADFFFHGILAEKKG